MTTPPPRKKKRVRPPRKIVPRANMGFAWIVAPIVIATAILIAGVWFLIINPR